MADSASNGPPQEGLDPKLKSLPDLAPAEGGATDVAITAMTLMNPPPSPPLPALDATAAADAFGAVAPREDEEEGPPQVGQDPKLLACVNDGEMLMRAGVTMSTNGRKGKRAAAARAAAAAAVPPPDTALDLHGVDARATTGNTDYASSGVGACATVIPAASPAKENVAAAMVSIQQTSSSPPPPPTTVPNGAAGNIKHEPAAPNAPPAPPSGEEANAMAIGVAKKVVTQSQQSVSNPSLTSAQSLAEWNRIHADTGPNYNFYKKRQQVQGNKKTAWIKRDVHDGARAGDVGREGAVVPKIEGAASMAAATAAPLPGANPPCAPNPAVVHAPKSEPPPPGRVAQQGPPTAASVDDLGNPQQQPPVQALPPPSAAPAAPTNSNFWLQEEEERFLLGLRLYGWGQWKRIQTIVQTRTNKQIKSHAQKREKVNPNIKFKYAKGKSRRGRISSKVLADDARAMATAAAAGGAGDGTGGGGGPVSADDAANVMLRNEGGDAPGLDEAWRDVYGTNNGDGPNSRHRRYRQQGLQPSTIEESRSRQREQIAMLERRKREEASQRERQPRQMHYPHPMAMPQPHQPHQHPHQQPGYPPQPTYPPRPPPPHQEPMVRPVQPPPAAPTAEHYNQHIQATKVGRLAASGPSPAQPLNNYQPVVDQAPQPPHLPQNVPPPRLTTADSHPPPASRYSSSAVHLPEAAVPPTVHAMPAAPIPAAAPANHVATGAAHAVPAPATNGIAHEPPTSKRTDTTSLRPGMRVYSRVAAADGSGDRWSPGTIYSAKIDPTKLSQNQHQTPQQKDSLPLVFHIQFEDGNEDPNVPEEDVMSKQFYEGAMNEIEWHHSLVRPAGYVSQYPHPLEGGTPVYCQWNDLLNTAMHGRWLPGTIHSCQLAADDGGGRYVYHVLFDAEGERQNIPQSHVVDRTEYHELAKSGRGNVRVDRGGRPVEELYDLFLRKERRGGDGSGGTGQLDLLSTASQIHTHGGAPPAAAAPRKREAVGGDVYDASYKRRATEQIKTRMAEQQTEYV